MNELARLLLILSLCWASVACGAAEGARRTEKNQGSGAGGSDGQLGSAGGAGVSIAPPKVELPSAECDDRSGSLGCSFYSVRLPRMPLGSGTAATNGACFAAFVVNAAPVAVSIKVEFQGTVLETQKFARIPRGSGASIRYEPLPSGMLPPNEVAILFLTHSPSSSLRCPSDVGYEKPLVLDDLTGTGYDQAFHITTSAPVAAYDIFPYGGGPSAVSSATLLLPTTVWDTNYLAVSAYAGSVFNSSTIQLVAQEDDTEVTLVPRVDIQPGKDLPEGKANQLQTYRLMRGEVLQLAAYLEEELAGTPVLANKPVGLLGALACANVPKTKAACDSLHQQIPPVRALGSRYVALRHRDRFAGQAEQAPFRLVGAVDGTRLTYSADKPSAAPASLQAGEVVDFRADAPFTVESQDAEHPFYLATYMSGCTEVSKDENDCRGDPEFVNVVPTEQYASSYVFFSDPTYPETSLALVRTRQDGAFKDVVLDCLASVTGWQPVSGSSDYEYARVELVSGNFEPQGNCDNGRHEIKSEAPFAVTVWGWGSGVTGGITKMDPGFSQAVSYAYPAGASVRAINSTVVPPVVK